MTGKFVTKPMCYVAALHLYRIKSGTKLIQSLRAEHSTHRAVQGAARTVQCSTAHTVQCCAAWCSAAQHIQCSVLDRIHSGVQSTTLTVWCRAQHIECGAQHSPAQHNTQGAVRCTAHIVQWRAQHVQCSTVQCSAAQHTPCGAVHSTHSAQHRTQYAVQGTARTMHCSMHSAAQHSTVQCTTHTMRCGVQHSQCKARCSTRSAGQPENCSAGRGGGVDMDARRRKGGGGGVGEMGFRVGPFVLCKNGCWRQRHRNTNHLEERLLDQAQARASYTPLFWGCSRSISRCMVSDV